MSASHAGSPFKRAVLVAIVLQLIMVVTGHYIPGVADRFPVFGTALSAVGGLLYGFWAKGITGEQAAGRGTMVGAIAAFFGILIAFVIGDTIAAVLVFGTASGAVAGTVGGVLGRMLANKTAA